MCRFPVPSQSLYPAECSAVLRPFVICPDQKKDSRLCPDQSHGDDAYHMLASLAQRTDDTRCRSLRNANARVSLQEQDLPPK